MTPTWTLPELEREIDDVRARILRHHRDLCEFFVGRDTELEMATLCAAAQEPLLFVGPPGTAKSELVVKFIESLGLPGDEYFEYMLTKFTEPSEILGPIDLDRLKEINDFDGDVVGARVITESGRAIGAAIEAPAFACRLGGDEFAVVMPGADLETMKALARRVLDAIAAIKLTHLGERLTIGASAGVAVGPAQGDEVFTLLRAADEALFRAKNEQRGEVRT